MIIFHNITAFTVLWLNKCSLCIIFSTHLLLPVHFESLARFPFSLSLSLTVLSTNGMKILETCIVGNVATVKILIGLCWPAELCFFVYEPSAPLTPCRVTYPFPDHLINDWIGKRAALTESERIDEQITKFQKRRHDWFWRMKYKWVHSDRCLCVCCTGYWSHRRLNRVSPL